MSAWDASRTLPGVALGLLAGPLWTGFAEKGHRDLGQNLFTIGVGWMDRVQTNADFVVAQRKQLRP